MNKDSSYEVRETIGLDLGDKYSRFCVLDPDGETLEAGRVKTTAAGIRKLGARDPGLVIFETGTHSAWIYELLRSLGHDVVIADARKVQLISKNQRKNDRLDAELLARLRRMDMHLLHPVKPRRTQTRRDLSVIRSAPR